MYAHRIHFTFFSCRKSNKQKKEASTIEIHDKHKQQQFVDLGCKNTFTSFKFYLYYHIKE